MYSSRQCSIPKWRNCPLILNLTCAKSRKIPEEGKLHPCAHFECALRYTEIPMLVQRLNCQVKIPVLLPLGKLCARLPVVTKIGLLFTW